MAAADSPVVADIDAEWHWVKEGVEEILSEQPQLTFTARTVYDACKAEQAVLWVTSEGFVISTGETDSFSGERTFLLWLAWAKDRGGNVAVKHSTFFVEAARSAGFSKIETRSPVPALREYLVGAGWNIETVVFVRHLDEQ